MLIFQRTAVAILLSGLFIAEFQAFASCSESFSPDETIATWSFGTWHAQISDDGGNPGAFLQDSFLEAALPRLVNIDDGTCFEGDYKKRRVNQVSFDLKVDFMSEPDGIPRPASLILWHDNDTPFDYEDDWGAVLVSEHDILSRSGWQNVKFFIPHKDVQIPSNWLFVSKNNATMEPDWLTLMSHVSYFNILMGNPLEKYNYHQWVIGVDNIQLSEK